MSTSPSMPEGTVVTDADRDKWFRARTGARHTFVIGSAKVFLGRLHGLHFETNKSFLLPAAIAGIRRIKHFYDQHPVGNVLVVGHTDRAGSNAYNLQLSEERAASIAAFLRDKVAEWMRWYDSSAPQEKRWGTREDQYMLSALAGNSGPFYTGAITGSKTAATRTAVRAFQGWSNGAGGTALAIDGDAGPKTREALVLAYMQQDETTLPEGVTIVTHGCGEFHPEEQTADGVASEKNRRVDVLLFEKSVQPAPVRCAEPGCSEYRQWRDAVVEEIDAEAPAGSVLEGRVFFRDGRPAPDVPFVVAVGEDLVDGGYTDDEGRYRIEDVSGDAQIRLCDRFLIAQTANDDGRVALAVVGGPAGGGLDGRIDDSGGGTVVA